MIYPVLAMVLLTFIVWLRMYHVRISEVRRGDLKIEELTPFNRQLPPRFITSGDNFRNLFEMPVLFYLAAVVSIVTRNVDPTLVALAWVFVGLRYAHSFIHITYNRILHRFAVYVLSSVVLWILWAVLAARLID